MSRYINKEDYRIDNTAHYDSSIKDMLKDCILRPIVHPIRLKGGRSIRPQVKPVYVYSEDATSFRIPTQVARKHKVYKPRTQLIQKEGYPINQISMREHQVGAINISLRKLAEFSTVLINFPPGFGKTIMAISLWRYIRMNCVILINRSILIASWKNTIELCFPGAMDTGKIKVWVPGECKQDDRDYSDGTRYPDIIICMVQRAKNMHQNIIDQMGVMIVDEGHLFCTTSHVNALTCFQPNFTIFATATPDRDNGMEKMLDLFVDRSSWVNITSKRPYYIDKVHTNVNLEGLCIENGVDVTFGNKYACAHKDPTRNSIIMDLIQQVGRQRKKCMVLTTTTEHVDILSDILDKTNASGSKHAKYYKSMKGCENYDILLGTVPKVGTGYDEATACANFDGVKSNVLILCTSVKSPGLFEQLSGRVMRSDAPHVVILMDKDHTPKNHFENLKPYIESTNGHIQSFYVHKPDSMNRFAFGNLSNARKLELMNDRNIEIDFTKRVRYDGPEFDTKFS